MEAKMSITVLPARKNAGSANKDEENPKLRVAAYCRVSTDSDEQATSYDAQIEHYTNYINGHPDWKLAGIFAEIIVSYMIRLRFRDFVKECKNLLIYRLSHTEGRADVLFFCLLFSTDYFERVQVGVHAGDFAHPYNDGTPHNDLQDDLL